MIEARTESPSLPLDDYVPPINNKKRSSIDVLVDQVEQFAQWWGATVRTHSVDAPGRLALRRRSGKDSKTDTDIVGELLQEYTLEQLKAMTVLAWTIAADGRWTTQAIARSDRSIRIIHHHAIFLSDELQRADGRTSAAVVETRLWSEICGKTALRIGELAAATWIRPCHLMWVRDGKAMIWAPTAEHRDGLRVTRLEFALNAAIDEVIGRPHTVEFMWGRAPTEATG
jgi:hypothetical protein